MGKVTKAKKEVKKVRRENTEVKEESIEEIGEEEAAIPDADITMRKSNAHKKKSRKLLSLIPKTTLH